MKYTVQDAEIHAGAYRTKYGKAAWEYAQDARNDACYMVGYDRDHWERVLAILESPYDGVRGAL